MASESETRNIPEVKPKTEEFLYLLLWSCEMLRRPTWRSMTESFEGWAYRTGWSRQLAALERRQFIESRKDEAQNGGGVSNRVLRLTERGRLQALGGRDPETQWRRVWDGRWRMVLFDLPAAEGTLRNRLRNVLRSHGFGWLQNSVWVSPDPVREEKAALVDLKVDVGSLLLLEARPAAGETDDEIVAAAWDFVAINRAYAHHLAILETRPTGSIQDQPGATALHAWAKLERQSWLSAVTNDPLLPERLLPAGYLGQKSWRTRVQALRAAGHQIRNFPG